MLIKVDLKSAYRIVPIHAADCHLLRIRWNGQVYVDQALPFGLRSALKMFTAIADTIFWALTESGVTLQIHYFDDFFSNTGTSSHIMPYILSVLDRLGVPVALNKVEGPSTVITFLGVEVNSERLRIVPHPGQDCAYP